MWERENLLSRHSLRNKHHEWTCSSAGSILGVICAINRFEPFYDQRQPSQLTCLTSIVLGYCRIGYRAHMKRKAIRRRDKVSRESRSSLVILSSRAPGPVRGASSFKYGRDRTLVGSKGRGWGDRHVRLITRFCPPNWNPADNQPLLPVAHNKNLRTTAEFKVLCYYEMDLFALSHFCAWNRSFRNISAAASKRYNKLSCDLWSRYTEWATLTSAHCRNVFCCRASLYCRFQTKQKHKKIPLQATTWIRSRVEYFDAAIKSSKTQAAAPEEMSS